MNEPTNYENQVPNSVSDPASGTEVSYRNDGTANTGYVSGQVEPLGQSVALTDPEPPNEPSQYPSSYEQYLFSARESEWQCKLPFSFQPVSCSIRAEIASAEVDFGVHSIYDPTKRAGDTWYMSFTYEESLDSLAMRYPGFYRYLYPTSKPKGQNNEPPTSPDDRYAEEHWRRKAEMQAVPETPGLYKYYDPNRDFQAFLEANPNCRSSLMKLGVDIDALYRSATFVNTVVENSWKGKTYRELGMNDEALGKLQLDFSSPSDNGQTFAETIGSSVLLYSNHFRNSTRVQRGNTIVHELLHIAWGNHVDVAQKLGLDIKHNWKELRKLVGDEIGVLRYEDPDTDLKASKYINAWMRNGCRRGQ